MVMAPYRRTGCINAGEAHAQTRQTRATPRQRGADVIPTETTTIITDFISREPTV